MNTFRRGRGLVASGPPRTAERKQEDSAREIGEQKNFFSGNPAQIAQDKPVVHQLKSDMDESAQQTDGSSLELAAPAVEENKKSDVAPANSIPSAINQIPASARGAFSRGRGLRGVIQNQGEQRPSQSETVPDVQSSTDEARRDLASSGAFSRGRGFARSMNVAGSQSSLKTLGGIGGQLPVITPVSEAFSRGRGGHNLGTNDQGVTETDIATVNQCSEMPTSMLKEGQENSDFGCAGNVSGGGASTFQTNIGGRGRGSGQARGSVQNSGSGTRGVFNHGNSSIQVSQRIVPENPGWDDDDSEPAPKSASNEPSGVQPSAGRFAPSINDKGGQSSSQTVPVPGDQPSMITPVSEAFSRGSQSFEPRVQAGIETNTLNQSSEVSNIPHKSAPRGQQNRSQPGFGSGFGRGENFSGGQASTFQTSIGGRGRGSVQTRGSSTRGSFGQENNSGRVGQRNVPENHGWGDDDSETAPKIASKEPTGAQAAVRGTSGRGRGGHVSQILTGNSRAGPSTSAHPQASSDSAQGPAPSNQNRLYDVNSRNQGTNRNRANDFGDSNRPRNDFGDSNRPRNENSRQNESAGCERPTVTSTNPECPDRKPASTYVPIVRSIEEIVKEDVEQSTIYATIADEDEDVIASYAGFSTKHKHTVAIDTWKDANFEEVLYNNIVNQCKYVRPRKIQAHAIPLILEGEDLKGLAETGSGKTAAFMLPIINIIMNCKQKVSLMERPSPYCIIIEPTRELCKQVYEQGLKFANGTGIGVKKAYGEFDVRRNRNELREGDGCDILCACPGRFKHLICDNWIDYTKVKILVFDEADQLLENDFLKTITDVLKIPGFPQKEKRQTLMFSATFPDGVQKLANETMKPESAIISKKAVVSANNRIIQKFISVDSKKKKSILMDLLKKEIDKAVEDNVEMPRFLVFVSKKKTADHLALYYSQQGIKTTTINGDRDQGQREVALRDFIQRDAYVLISTDVCARGIDIKNLDHVINYDLPRFKGEGPKDADDKQYDERPITYVQRIGRTGRLRAGTSISFFDELDDNDREFAAKLVELVRGVGQEPADFVVKAADDYARISSFVPPENPWGDDDDDDVPLAPPVVPAPVMNLADIDDWS